MGAQLNEWFVIARPVIPDTKSDRQECPTFCPSRPALVAGRDRLAKINERLKLGKPGRALNGDLWVLQSPDQKCDLERDGEDKAE